MLAEGDFRLLRPIAVEHDPDHDHGACRDHHRADHRPLFEHSDKGCPSIKVLFICAKRQPATPIRKLRLAPAATV
jgi:hypothetical protein